MIPVAMDMMDLAMLATAFATDPFSLTTQDVATLEAFNALFDRETSPTIH